MALMTGHGWLAEVAKALGLEGRPVRRVVLVAPDALDHQTDAVPARVALAAPLVWRLRLLRRPLDGGQGGHGARPANRSPWAGVSAARRFATAWRK